jgi:arylsulfatase A-like enzyme
VGRVLSALEALPHDAAAHTVVVFTADHGFSLGDQGGWGKRTLWETDARVPLLVRPPPRLPWLRGRVAAAPLGVGAAAGSAFGLEGARSRALVELVDLFPTLAELARLGHDPLLVATAAAARASARAVPAAAAAARPDDSAAALAEPPLDGTSFAHLLYPPDNARRSRRAAAGEARRAASQFPRCPVKVSRAGGRPRRPGRWALGARTF